MMRRTFTLGIAMGLAAGVGAQTAAAQDDRPSSEAASRSAVHAPIHVDSVPDLNGLMPEPTDEYLWFPEFTTTCSGVETHSGANFGGGAFVGQGGFAEGEIAAVSFTVPADAFPIRVVSTEAIFVTVGATVVTTTEWSMLIWEGTPDTGTLLYEFSSDDVILPHLVAGPGDTGTNIQLSVDPNDPDQIFLFNDDGSATFTVGYRIDKHNAQTVNPCTQIIPANLNAFPSTDTDGLSQAAQNWIFAINCGSLSCVPGGGWARFSELPNSFPFLCRPSGDWNIRATWESVNCNPNETGACCLTDGSCIETDQESCDSISGTYQGDDTLCAQINCPPPTQACCFEQTSGCLDLDPAQCTLAGGVPGGVGTECASTICFPMGAACLPDGSCVDGVSPEEAAMMGAVFQGDGTTCGTVECPEPVGAACFPNGACLELTEAQADIAGATWAGPGTTCESGACDDCPADLADTTGFGAPDGLVDFGDFFALSFLVGPCGAGTTNPDCDGDLADDSGFGAPDGMVSFGDFFAMSFEVGPCD